MPEHGTGDRSAAEAHLILLGLAARLPNGTLHRAPDDVRDAATL